ncbi:hypothetical protein GH714_017345 [Hevea brasiliensis]|uniref:BED-type domain-containing protein n=1 Tax=Hevea brasiliensis TaxID=3981 RepID=A0A6A6MD03_HEVBR|nr:hypothetical protein GH714_017345 [Hevea brasiliensis]
MAQQETTNDLLVEPSHPPPVASSQTEVDEAISKMKRKGMKPRSAVWDHFSKFVDGSGIQKGKCNYCYKEFFCDPTKIETTALRNHMFACIKNSYGMTTRQSQLSLQPSSSIQEGGGSHCGTLNTWNLKERSRRNLAKTIIVDELHLCLWKGKGLRNLWKLHNLVVVDPLYKLDFMEFALSTVYGKEKGMELAKKIKLTVYELFDEYKKTYQAEHRCGSNVARNTSENNESEGAKNKSRLNLGEFNLKHKIEIGEVNSKSDLNCYLNEGIKVVDEKEEFDI